MLINHHECITNGNQNYLHKSKYLIFKTNFEAHDDDDGEKEKGYNYVYTPCVHTINTRIIYSMRHTTCSQHRRIEDFGHCDLGLKTVI